MIKIADATAGIREQHDWCARTAGCAFQRHVTDFDVEAIEGRRLRFKERRLGGSRTSAGYEARSGSCRCAGEQVTARQSRFAHPLPDCLDLVVYPAPTEESEYAWLAWRRVVPPVAFVPRAVDVKRDQEFRDAGVVVACHSPTPIQFRSRPRASLPLHTPP